MAGAGRPGSFLFHVEVALGEGDGDAVVVEGFFDLFVHGEVDGPVVGGVGPDADGEVDGAVG